jgi:microcystin-dependent protein
VSDLNAARPVSAGGTGAATAADARDALGVTAELGSIRGQVAYFAMSAAPTGWLKCNGAAVSRTTYADLFAAIGTTWGEGDGSTTFQLPDLRGEFIRGWDDGRGEDSGRDFGSHQDDIVGPHAHSTTGNRVVTSAGGTGLASGASLYWNGNFPVVASAITSGGGTETRPRNVALLACIKY